MQKEHTGSLAWGLRELWALQKASPDFKPPEQSEEDFKAASLCFNHANDAGSTHATVAQACGKDEDEVKRLLDSFDIDRLDAEGAKCRRHADDDLAVAQTQAVERRKAKMGATVAHAQQTTPKPDEAPGEVTYLHPGCTEFTIEDDRTLSLRDQHTHRVYILSKTKGIAKLLAQAVSNYTGGEDKQ